MALIDDLSTGGIAELSKGGVNIAVMLIVIVFVIAVLIGIWFGVGKWRRYQQFICEIWQRDGFGQFKIKYDKAGIFVDEKTKNKRLFLKSHNVGLDPDNIPYLTTAKGKRKILLLQTGLKNFKYIKPVVREDMFYFTVGEEDVNWAINSYERQKSLFAQSWILQYMPFIILAFVCIVVLILFTQIFNKFPLILEMTQEMKAVAQALSAAKSGTTVIPVG